MKDAMNTGIKAEGHSRLSTCCFKSALVLLATVCFIGGIFVVAATSLGRLLAKMTYPQFTEGGFSHGIKTYEN